ncbi:glycosyltransferase family 2 protein [Arcticibacter sp. MXS-1]|uniref:glycosyltransferase family 2 protein n=1 Tax=Arcticibacter sp. MXS-1 TaxID=3341726 RepID=UPI0035A8C704
MSLLTLPTWIRPHCYTGKRFGDLTAQEIDQLKARLQNFRDPNPDVSVVIPAWNEGDNIYRALSSLAFNETSLKVEIVVINNNSTDHTQEVLDKLGVISYFQPLQGIAFARQMGLEKAKGKYYLCADADTFYPPRWMELMTAPMIANENITGVYGRYSFVPPPGSSRAFLWFYERMAGIAILMRKSNREHLNVLGFNMGLVSNIGRETGGFNVEKIRKFSNAKGSADFVDESEDGRMAINLKRRGRLFLVRHPAARVFTSSRRLIAEGGILKALISRVQLHSSRIKEYLIGK